MNNKVTRQSVCKNVQSNYGDKYDDGRRNGAPATAMRDKPLRELGEDKTSFYALNK